MAERFNALEARFAATSVDDVRHEAVLQALGDDLAGRRVLDLGCGKGGLSRLLRDRGAEVVAFDIASAMLSQADSRLMRVKGNARSLPLRSGVFDAVAIVEALQHVLRIDDVLAEAARVLKPGGTLIVIDKNAAGLNAQRPWLPAVWVKRIDQWRGLWMYRPGDLASERWFFPSRMAARIKSAGFADIRVEHLLSPKEAERAVFRAIPRTRLLAMWSGRSAARTR